MTRGFVAAAAVALAIPAVTVVWLGWLLVRSDRELDRQRVQERLDAAATLVVGALDRSLATTDQRLATVASATGPARPQAAAAFQLSPADGAVVVFEAGGSWSSTPLAWYPDGAPLPEDDTPFAFLDAEALEFRGELAAAATAYQDLARSTDRQVRAGALARLARVARKRGQPAAALAAYDVLATMTDATSLGRPADLLARLERLELLQGPRDEVRRAADARALGEALVAGQWRLERSQFDFYRSRLATHAPDTPRLAIAEAVSSGADAVAAAGPAALGGRLPGRTPTGAAWSCGAETVGA